MKRLGAFLGAVLVASVITGCGEEGIKEGTSTDPGLPTGQPPGFKEQMERDAGKMKMGGGPPAESKKAAAAAAAEKPATP